MRKPDAANANLYKTSAKRQLKLSEDVSGFQAKHFRFLIQSLCIPMADVSEANQRRILVAVDQGEESAYALSWCIKNLISENSKDTLILLYARPPRIVYTALDGTGYLFSSDIIETMEKYSMDVAGSVMEKATRVCKDLQNVKVETKVESGDPRDLICEMAEKLAVDVLVMGSHGYGLIKRPSNLLVAS